MTTSRTTLVFSYVNFSTKRRLYIALLHARNITPLVGFKKVGAKTSPRSLLHVIGQIEWNWA
jgi:hypothetical protein